MPDIEKTLQPKPSVIPMHHYIGQMYPIAVRLNDKVHIKLYNTPEEFRTE